MSDDEKLKPCPLCGGRPHIGLYGDFELQYYLIRCRCGLRLDSIGFDPECTLDVEQLTIEDDLIDAWNRRI